MNSNTYNEQQSFWTGDFGNEYIARNQGQVGLANNTSLFAKIMERTSNINTVLEFGANIGLNLIALKTLIPKAKLSGVEINRAAFEQLEKIPDVLAYHSSIENFDPINTVDFTFTKTVLIHINPRALNIVYEKLYSCSNRYVLLVEYYNPTPIEVSYRGHSGKLFKRDFAGEMLGHYPDLRLIDYGFVYHKDTFYQDDITWFLMEKVVA